MDIEQFKMILDAFGTATEGAALFAYWYWAKSFLVTLSKLAFWMWTFTGIYKMIMFHSSKAWAASSGGSK